MQAPQESDTAPGAAQSAKACTNCARVKCKCIRRADGANCERCHRLKKDCTPAVVVRRRGAKRHPTSRVARVEEKLNDIVSLLKIQERMSGRDVANDVVDGEHVGAIVEEAEHAASEPSTVTPSVAFLTPSPTNGGNASANSSSHAASTPSIELPHPYEPSTSEAEDSLKKFREETAAFFPFFNIPLHVTSQRLRYLYPFQWLNIMSVTSTSPRRRLALGDQARGIIIQKIVVEREKSLDLLLGMLTFMGWGHLQRNHKMYAPLFSQLIITMVCDLGLHRPSPQESSPLACSLKDPKRERSDEERRAALGAFVLTSMISHIFRGAGGLRWSPCLEGYLTHLDQNSTILQDQILVAQVRLQLIIEQLQHAPWAATGGVIPPLYLFALRSQLHDVTTKYRTNGTSRIHPMVIELSHYTELLIYESAVSKSPTPWNEPSLQRFEVYQGCLTSIKAWLDSFFLTPFAVFHSRPFSTYYQTVRVMACLHNITTVEDPAWDGAAVRKVVDLIPTLDKLIGNFEQLAVVSALLSPDGGEDEAYAHGVAIFRHLKLCWQGDLENMDVAVYGNQDTSTVDNDIVMPISITDGCAWLSAELDGITWG